MIVCNPQADYLITNLVYKNSFSLSVPLSLSLSVWSFPEKPNDSLKMAETNKRLKSEKLKLCSCTYDK